MSDDAAKHAILNNAAELFKVYDANKTGALDFAELQQAVKKVYHDLGKPEPKFLDFADILKKYDKNGDRLIDLDEFKQFLLEVTGNK